MSKHSNPDVRHAGELLRSRRSADAIPLLTEYLSKHPTDTWALSELAFAKQFTGDFAGAIAARTEIVRLRPDLPCSFVRRGFLLEAAGDLPAAINDFTDAIELDPTLPGGYFRRGRAKVKIGEFRSALQDFTGGLNHAVMSGEERLQGSCHINRGTTYYLLGECDAAIQDLSAAMELSPFTCITSALYRGIARKSSGDHLGAIADFTLVIEDAPTISNAYIHRAEARRITGDVTGAGADESEYKRLGGVDLPSEVDPIYWTSGLGRGISCEC